jgi:hypothetical protein
MNGPGVFAAVPDVAALPNGDAVLVWTELLGSQYTTKSSIWSAATGSWGAQIPLLQSSTEGWGAVRMAAKANGDIVATLQHQVGGIDVVAVWSRDYATGRWSDPVDLAGSSVPFLSLTNFSLDSEGNALVSWDEQPASIRSVHVAIADGAGPQLKGLAVPSSGIAGTPLAFSVSPFDLWSSLATTSWDFGDGGAATGGDAVHTYTEAGTHTVTARATDTLGNTTTTTRQIEIAAAPATTTPTTTPAVTLAPKVARALEANLTGKTIRITAAVKTLPGKKCAGTMRAATTVAGAYYRTTLKLKKNGKACIASGTIKLRKAPAKTARVQVKVSGKQATTRAVTARRDDT